MLSWLHLSEFLLFSEIARFSLVLNRPVTEEDWSWHATQEAFHGNPAVSSLSVDFLRKERPQMPSAALAACDHKTRVSLTQGRERMERGRTCVSQPAPVLHGPLPVSEWSKHLDNRKPSSLTLTTCRGWTA